MVVVPSRTLYKIGRDTWRIPASRLLYVPNGVDCDRFTNTGDPADRAAAGIPDALLALYERIRTQTGGTGAAMLKARQCQGCRLELYGNELSAVRNADPHEVVRCENCGRILVRTAESGL